MPDKQETVPTVVEEVPTEKEKKKELKPDSIPKRELQLMTLIGQREKMSRDDLTTMILAREESLKMLIRKPSEELIEFIKANLQEEDNILIQIPRFEMPKSDFEAQVIREMRLVLRDNADKIFEKVGSEELIKWDSFKNIYEQLDSFDYPHKEKLLDFIKYFFLDHIIDADNLMMNFQAFKDTLSRKQATSGDKTRNETGSIKSRKKSGDSQGSYGGSADELAKKRMLAGSGVDHDKYYDEEI